MITLVSGTNRQGSNTLKVTLQSETILKSMGQDTTLLDLTALPREVFTPEVYGEKPESFKDWTDSVLSSDGLVIVIPEYNGSFPGMLKFFIDLLPFPESFEAKPVAFIGLSAGQFGALRAVEQMELVFGYRNAYLFPNRLFLPAVHKRLDENGRLNSKEDTERLTRLLEGFVRFTGQLKGHPGTFSN